MVYINQLSLDGKLRDQNQEFLRLVHTCDEWEEADIWFDKLDGKIQRELDNDMTLDEYVELMGRKEPTTMKIVFNSPTPREIGYFCSCHDELGVNRMAWMKCPYNEHNLEVMQRLFMTAFGTELEKEPVPQGLLEYYQWRVKNYNI